MRIVLIGDSITDVNRYGKATRLCPEAPCPVWVPESQDERHGGMGLVADNLTALGADGVVHSRSHSKKIRYWSGEHLLMREDQDSLYVAKESIPQKVVDAISTADAVIISDYAKGGITDEDALRLTTTDVPVFVDTKRADPSVYTGCFAIFPNEVEYPKLHSRYEHIIRKAGSNGCYVDEKHVPGNPVQTFDVTGAGDVFLATFVWAYLQNKDLLKAAEVANRAASISVQHVGGYVLSPTDVALLSEYF